MSKRGGHIFTPFGLTVLCLLAAAGAAIWLAYLPWRWERTKNDFRKRFPDVRRIDADGAESLKTWYGKSDVARPVVIDVRPQAEYDYSHLPGAKHMGLTETPESFGLTASTNAPLVIYDAVGADAFPVAESLMKRGYARVQVLEGGIYEWANRGLPLSAQNGPVSRVLPGKSQFAPLLKRRVTAPVTAAK